MAKPQLNIETLAAAEEAYLITGERAEDDADWGDPFLDNAVGPLQIGGVYTFAARKGTGKSFSMLRQLLLIEEPSMYISLEDPRREIGRRVAAAPGLRAAKERVKLYIPARPKLTVIIDAMVKAKARVVGIDYLQVIQDDSGVGTFDRAGQVRNVITELKAVARESRISILLNAQLRRPESTHSEPDPGGFGEPSEKEPRGTIFHIRDSSDVENQSEAVILIHRLGRTKFDQTVAAVKGRLGGERRVFARGPGGWPEEVKGGKTASAPSRPVRPASSDERVLAELEKLIGE